jgi:hypothetical protein
VNTLDVAGGLAVGSFAGNTPAPTNGALIAGQVGIGTSSVGTDHLVVSGGSSTIQRILSSNPSGSAFAFSGSSVRMQSSTTAAGTSEWGIHANVGGLLIFGSQQLSGNLYFSKNGSAVAVMSASHFGPYSDSQLDLGSSSFRWNALYYTAGVLGTSDARMKTDIEPISYGLSDVMRMRPVSFSWKRRPHDGPQLGLIAQELKKIVPEVVLGQESETDMLAVNHIQLIPILIKAIQEQQRQIEDLNAKLRAAEDAAKQIENLQVQLNQLESLIKAEPNSGNK